MWTYLFLLPGFSLVLRSIAMALLPQKMCRLFSMVIKYFNWNEMRSLCSLSYHVDCFVSAQTSNEMPSLCSLILPYKLLCFRPTFKWNAFTVFINLSALHNNCVTFKSKNCVRCKTRLNILDFLTVNSYCDYYPRPLLSIYLWLVRCAGMFIWKINK